VVLPGIKEFHGLHDDLIIVVTNLPLAAIVYRSSAKLKNGINRIKFYLKSGRYAHASTSYAQEKLARDRTFAQFAPYHF